MIRVRHVILPAGLTAFVRRSERGELEVFVAAGLEPARIRSAVRLALRSYGARGWRGALLPLPLLLPFTGGLSWLHALARIVRAHAIGAAAAAAGVGMAAATSAVLIVSVPPQHHAVAGATPVPAQIHHRSRPGAVPSPQPGSIPAAIPTARPAQATGRSTSQPHRRTTSTGPSPGASTSAHASPSPSPTGGSGTSNGDGCLRLLGLSVCL